MRCSSFLKSVKEKRILLFTELSNDFFVFLEGFSWIILSRHILKDSNFLSNVNSTIRIYCIHAQLIDMQLTLTKKMRLHFHIRLFTCIIELIAFKVSFRFFLTSNTSMWYGAMKSLCRFNLFNFQYCPKSCCFVVDFIAITNTTFNSTFHF